MTMLALDWNATRVRAVLGKAGGHALPFALEPPLLELPLAIRLDKSAAIVGSAALRMCRSAGHLVCDGFLPHLANPSSRWQTDGHPVDAHAACDIVWQKLNHLAASAAGVVLTVPGYLRTQQADALCKLGNAANLAVLGSVPAPLAAALIGHAEQFWQRSVLVLDADDHALTLGWVKALGDKAHLIECRSFTPLGVGVWKERLLDALSDLCVRQHRRDPRDAPLAEQSLYDQLDPLIDAALKRQPAQLGVQAQQWFKHLLVQPEETARVCQPLVSRIVEEAEQLMLCWPASELPRTILLTHQAARLPGLIEGLEALTLPSASAETKLPAKSETNYHDDDFGEDLMFGEADAHNRVLVLPPEAPARGAHGLAELFCKGTLPAGHLEAIVSLPPTAQSRIPAARSVVRSP